MLQDPKTYPEIRENPFLQINFEKFGCVLARERERERAKECKNILIAFFEHA